MLLLWTYFALSFSALLPLINPLGSALIFLSLVGPAPIPIYHSLARRIAINTVLFLTIIDPLGSALIFLSLVGPAPIPIYHSLARRIAINTVLFLTIIDLVGSALLRFFGISLPIVQVSGGLVIAAIAWSMLNPESNES